MKYNNEQLPLKDNPITNSNDSIIKRNKWSKNVFSLGFIIFIICCFFYAIGGRLTPYQAAQANDSINKESKLLGIEDFGSSQVFLFENPEKYYTVIADYQFPFWRSSTSFWANKTDDSVKLVGWCSYRTKDIGFTIVPIQSLDKNVSYIEMGPGIDRIRKEITYEQIVAFTWEKNLPWNDLEAIAYSKEGEELYKLGYEIKNSTIKPSELRWLPIE